MVDTTFEVLFAVFVFIIGPVCSAISIWWLIKLAIKQAIIEANQEIKK